MKFPRWGVDRRLTSAVVFVILGCSLSGASEPPPGSGDTRAQVLDLGQVNPVAPSNGFLHDLILRYLPEKLTVSVDPQSVSSEIQNKVGQKVGQDFIKNSFLQDRGVERLFSSLKTSVNNTLNSFQSSDQNPSSLKFQILPDRAQAEVHYSGFFQSSLRLDGQDQNVLVDIYKDFCASTKLVLHYETPMAEYSPSTHLLFSYSF